MSPHRDITLNDNWAICLDKQEPKAIKMAAQSLAEDIQDVLGGKIPIRAKCGRNDAGVIFIGCRGKEADQRLDISSLEPECFRIRSSRLADGRPIVHINGADTRGTIYGIYHFSERYLGTDPLKFWTGYKPPKRTRVLLGDIDQTSPPPAIPYRGWFIAQEDLITGWQWDPKMGIPLHLWDRIFETLLRLRGNAIIPGNYVTPSEPQYARAVEMGLLIQQHHLEPVGANPAAWRKKQFSHKDKKGMIQHWKRSIRQLLPIKDSVLWTVGFRGQADQAFWFEDPHAPSSYAGRAKVIRDAIKTQIELIKEITGDTNPRCFAYLWSEQAVLHHMGVLRFPKEVVTVWCNDGFGNMRHLTAETEKVPMTMAGKHMYTECLLEDPKNKNTKHGVYYHVNMYVGEASQYTQLISPQRIEREFRKIFKRKATASMVLNVGNIREVVLGIAAVMEIAWEGQRVLKPRRSYADDFYKRWCQKYFGKKAASLAKKAYELLYDAPWDWQLPEMQPGINTDHYISRGLIKKAITGEAGLYNCNVQWLAGKKPLSEQALYFEERSASSLAKWDKALQQAQKALPLVPVARRRFFSDNILVQIQIGRASNRMLFHISQAVLHHVRGEYADAESSIEQAMQAVKAIYQAQKEAQWGKWRDWYKMDLFIDMGITEDTIRTFRRVVRAVGKSRRDFAKPTDLEMYAVMRTYQDKGAWRW